MNWNELNLHWTFGLILSAYLGSWPVIAFMLTPSEKSHSDTWARRRLRSRWPITTSLVPRWRSWRIRTQRWLRRTGSRLPDSSAELSFRNFESYSLLSCWILHTVIMFQAPKKVSCCHQMYLLSGGVCIQVVRSTWRTWPLLSSHDVGWSWTCQTQRMMMMRRKSDAGSAVALSCLIFEEVWMQHATSRTCHEVVSNFIPAIKFFNDSIEF